MVLILVLEHQFAAGAHGADTGGRGTFLTVGDSGGGGGGRPNVHRPSSTCCSFSELEYLLLEA